MRKERFVFLREGEKLPEGMKLLAIADKTVSCDSAVIYEAKQLLRVKAQSFDANAVIGLTMYNWGRGWFVAEGVPALLVKESIDELEAKKKQEAFLQTMQENGLMFVHEYKQYEGVEFRVIPAVICVLGLLALGFF